MNLYIASFIYTKLSLINYPELVMSNILVQYLERSALLQSVLVYVYYSCISHTVLIMRCCWAFVWQTIWAASGSTCLVNIQYFWSDVRTGGRINRWFEQRTSPVYEATAKPWTLYLYLFIMCPLWVKKHTRLRRTAPYILAIPFSTSSCNTPVITHLFTLLFYCILCHC